MLRSRFAGTPKPIAPIVSSERPRTASSSASSTSSSEFPGSRPRSARGPTPSRSTTPERIFVPPTSTPITRGAPTAAGYHSAPNGRGRQALPALSRWPRQGQSPSRRGASSPRRNPQLARRSLAVAGAGAVWIVLAVVGLLVLTVVWGVLGYLSFSSGVDEANQRLPRRAEGRLADQTDRSSRSRRRSS